MARGNYRWPRQTVTEIPEDPVRLLECPEYGTPQDELTALAHQWCVKIGRRKYIAVVGGRPSDLTISDSPFTLRIQFSVSYMGGLSW